MDLELHELTAAYALEALEPEERDAFEAHLASCERCQEELASFWEVTGALAFAATGPAPSDALRDRILESVRAEPQHVVPLESRRRRLTPVLGAVTAVAAVVAIGLGIYAVSLNSELDDTRTALAQQQTTAAILADPSATTVALQAGEGRLVVASGGDAVLVLDGVEQAPSGKTYQVWIVQGQTPTSAGLFRGTDGTDVVPVAGKVQPGEVVAVTLEPAGGSAAPTTTPLAASNPV